MKGFRKKHNNLEDLLCSRIVLWHTSFLSDLNMTFVLNGMLPDDMTDLEFKIAYKCQRNGIRVEFVDARYTS